MPTPEEEAAADRLPESVETSEDAAEHYREMAERGAHQQGEGRID